MKFSIVSVFVLSMLLIVAGHASAQSSHRPPSSSSPAPTAPQRVFCAGVLIEGSPENAVCYESEQACVAEYREATRFDIQGSRFTPCRSVEAVYCFDYIEQYSTRHRNFCLFNMQDCDYLRSRVRGTGLATTSCESRTDTHPH